VRGRLNQRKRNAALKYSQAFVGIGSTTFRPEEEVVGREPK